MNWKNWLSVGATAFLGGVMGYVTLHLGNGVPATAADWKAFGLGAAMAGLASLVHLFQDPGSSGGGGPSAPVVKLAPPANTNGPTPPAAARRFFGPRGMRSGTFAAFAFAVFGVSMGMASCTSSGAPSPQVVGVIGPGIDFSVCVIGQAAQCAAAKTPALQCTAQIVQACGGDAVAIAKVLDAHRAAEVREGFVLPPDAGE